MSKRLLIINPFDKKWKNIPMGSFGICDYLEQKGKSARIFNASSYPYEDHLSKLNHVIREYEPDLIGVIAHWKELLKSALYLCFFSKRCFPDIPVVLGGITASFFCEELLKQFRSIDFIIRGDAEVTLEELMSDAQKEDIPNLVHRHGSKVIHNKMHITDAETLNTMCFTELKYAIDYRKYISQIVKPSPIGFPLMLGRGCQFNCTYCGGSNKAFKEHSSRHKIVLRSIPSILEDLRILLNYTDRIYMCYETSQAFISQLFEAIECDDELSGKFICDYGTWSLLNDRMIRSYKRAFKQNRKKKAIIEISPETSIEADRKIIRDRRLYYSNREMKTAVQNITDSMEDSIHIMIFYSRYHATHTPSKIMREIHNIHKLREWLFRSNLENKVFVKFAELSTDPGSDYWDVIRRDIGTSDSVAYLLSFIDKQKRGMFQPDNLCMFKPQGIDEIFSEKCRRLTRLISLCLIAYPHFYYASTAILGVGRLFGILEQLSECSGKKEAGLKDGFVKISTMIDSPDPRHESWKIISETLLDYIWSQMKHNANSLKTKQLAFLKGLYEFSMKRLNSLSYSNRESIENMEACGGRPIYNEKPKLDDQYYLIAEYDYLSKTTYNSLYGNDKWPPKTKNVFIFCPDDVYRFDYMYDSIFKKLDGSKTIHDILNEITSAESIKPDDREFVSSFIKNKYYYFTS